MPLRAGTADSTVSNLAAIRDLATIDLWHPTRPNAADLLGISRDLAYEMARDGRLPTLRLGRRQLVAVPVLRQMLGDL